MRGRAQGSRCAKHSVDQPSAPEQPQNDIACRTVRHEEASLTGHTPGRAQDLLESGWATKRCRCRPRRRVRWYPNPPDSPADSPAPLVPPPGALPRDRCRAPSRSNDRSGRSACTAAQQGASRASALADAGRVRAKLNCRLAPLASAPVSARSLVGHQPQHMGLVHPGHGRKASGGATSAAHESDPPVSDAAPAQRMHAPSLLAVRAPRRECPRTSGRH
jgi:hypothetical protein